MSADSTRQYGLSMVELLVAMALGLLLTVGALQMMLASQQLYDTTDSQSRIQENGRFALDFLSRELSKAYYQTTDIETMANRTFLTDSCITTDPNDIDACTEDDPGHDDNNEDAGDRIGAVFNPENDRDCVGNTVGPDDIIANVFYVDTVDGISALYCGGFSLESDDWINGGPRPLVDGVESLQILYRVELAGGGSFSYVSADDVTDWAAVSAIRVAVLVNNGQEIGSGNLETRTFTLLDAGPFSLTDKHERQVYSTTITLNNVIYNNAEK